MISVAGIALLAITQVFSIPSTGVVEKAPSIELVMSEKSDVLPCDVVRDLAALNDMVNFYQQIHPEAVLELNGNRQYFVSNAPELITLLRITTSWGIRFVLHTLKPAEYLLFVVAGFFFCLIILNSS